MRNRLDVSAATLALVSATRRPPRHRRPARSPPRRRRRRAQLRRRIDRLRRARLRRRDGDAARYERYRDLRNGVVVASSLRQGDADLLLRRRAPRTSATAISGTRSNYDRHG